MSLKYKHTLLFVDDEESITKTLRRVFRNEGYEIHTASSGKEGLACLKEADKPFSLIISDQRMPGMSGSQFLEEARKILPNAMRILLTGYSDVEAIVDAINKGGIQRYLTKPWNDEDILFQVRQTLEQYELLVENKRLLKLTKEQNDELTDINKNLEEKVEQRTEDIIRKNKELGRLNSELEANLYNSVKSFSSLVERHSPLLMGHGRRVAFLSQEIAQFLNLEQNDIVQIEIAGLLHDIGKLGFPEKLLMYKEKEWTPGDKELFRKHPLYGQETVHFISNLDHAGLLIRSHHERYDGGGYPDQLTEEEIPLGARIIAVADVYDKIVNLQIDVENTIKKTKLENTNLNDEEILQKAAVSYLKKESFLNYDPDVVKALLNILKSGGAIYGEEKRITIDELKEDMTLSKPLYSSSGRFLLPQKAILTKDFISRLQLIHGVDPITEDIYVLRK